MIVLPLIFGAGLFFVRPEKIRAAIVTGVCAILVYCTMGVTGWFFTDDLTVFPVSGHAVSVVMMALEAAMALYIVYVGIRHRRPLIVLLAVTQTALMAWFEMHNEGRLAVQRNLLVDKLSIIMALIITLVGGAICYYAIGYMREFHDTHHKGEFKDRRPLFFGVLLIFMGAMNGVVFSNNLMWLYFFWEVTTLCSFLLIGYKQTEESKNNALRALLLNLVGGLAFAGGIVLFHARSGSIELDQLMAGGNAAYVAPAALLCLAGISKSAQFPFSSWLLGAMVAPTPVSALLHSSTMVKAGVYLVIRMATVMEGTTTGTLVALVGSVTFLIGSFAAIGTSDAKKVLAHSTIANLGLIVMCGGIGTYESVWAGILMIIFHAIAKALLFLCVGVVEHKLHSRDIESMSGLVLSMPRISVMLQIGMAGMFLAPFGMLISKWAVLKAVVDAHPMLVIFIAFGSAATLFFWVKWMGKLIEVTHAHENVEQGIGFTEWSALTVLTALTTLTCVMFPVISDVMIEPYILEKYHHTAGMEHGNLVIMLIMLGMIALFPLSFMSYGRKIKVLDVYLGGGNIDEGKMQFLGSGGKVLPMQMRNYYLSEYLSEAWLVRFGVALGLVLMAALGAAIIL